MPEPLVRFLQAFIPLFVAIDPIGLAAVFLALSHGVPLATRRRIGWQATATGGLVALGFLFLGQNVFTAVGVSVKDFQIAGGLILFILAARDLTLPEGVALHLPEDFGIVPLGMPLIAGPALITTLLLLAETQGMLIDVARWPPTCSWWPWRSSAASGWAGGSDRTACGPSRRSSRCCSPPSPWP